MPDKKRNELTVKKAMDCRAVASQRQGLINDSRFRQNLLMVWNSKGRNWRPLAEVRSDPFKL